MGMSSTKAIWTLEPEGVELTEKTIGEMLDLRAGTHGDAQALVFRAPETGIDRAWTYKQLREDAVLYARALIGLGILAFAGAPPMVIHPLGLLLFAGRVLHAIGLSRSGGVSWPRTYGVLATWTAYIALAAALLFFAIP